MVGCTADVSHNRVLEVMLLRSMLQDTFVELVESDVELTCSNNFSESEMF